MPGKPEQFTATFERPVLAHLVVRTEHGEEWDATDTDLDRFRLGRRLDLDRRAQQLLREALGLEPGDSWPEKANAVRYMIECALMYDHSPWADENGRPWEGEDSGEHIEQTIRDALGDGQGDRDRT